LRDKKKIVENVRVWIPQPLVPSILLNRNMNGKILARSSSDAAVKDEDELVVKDSTINTSDAGAGSRDGIVGGTPSYLVVGGLVFVTLTKEYVKSTFDTRHMTEVEGWAEEYRILSCINKPKAVRHEEMVLLSQVIAHQCNIGYESYNNFHLIKFNGEKVVNLKHLKDKVDEAYSRLCTGIQTPPLVTDASKRTSTNSKKSKKSKASSSKPEEESKSTTLSSDNGDNLVFEFSDGQVVVMNAHAALNARETICKEHLIPSSCSDDLEDVLE